MQFPTISENQTQETEILQQATQQCGVKPHQIERIYQCTAHQEELISWSAQHNKGSILVYEFMLPHGIEKEKFQAAWNTTVDANAILQTRIVKIKDGEIYLALLQEPIPWDLREPKQPIPEDWYAKDQTRGQSLIRFALSSSLTTESLFFTIMIHRAFVDEQLFPQLLEQTGAAYTGVYPPRQAFHNFMKNESWLSDATNFWKTHLVDISTVDFPKLPSPKYISNPCARTVVTIPRVTTVGPDSDILNKLEFCWAMLVSIYTQNVDVVFGVTQSENTSPASGTEEYFEPMDTYPVRFLHCPDDTVSDAIGKLELLATKRAPFENTGLQFIKRLGHDAANACQFKSLLNFQRKSAKGSEMFERRRTLLHATYSNPYALILDVQIQPREILINVNFDPDVLPQVAANALAHQLRHVFGQVETNPDQCLKDMDLLSPEDRSQLQTWNGYLPSALDVCVHGAIQEKCLAQPDYNAVSAWDGNFTYRELDNHSTCLARTLAEYNIGPNVFVPVYFERTRWTTVAMLGILKAGGALLLLDPSHPTERLRDILRDIDATVILATTVTKSKANEIGSQIIVIGDDEFGWKQSHETAKASSSKPADALFAVFTSGSTGKPKGAVISHESFYTNFHAHHRALGLSQRSRILQFASHAFDMSVADHLWALLVGGCVCIPSREDTRFNLDQAITDYHVNWISLTPSMARTLTPDRVPLLETLVLIGEPMTPGDVEMWPSRVNLRNMYGPAECSIMTTLQDVRNSPTLNNIGFSQGAACWIVDPNNHHRLVPLNTVGELIIEGTNVGDGYLKRPDLTEAVFIDAPNWLKRFRSHHGRLYKTGDLVQYAVDGSLNYKGRKDSQVKLRGQRIELEEVAHKVQRVFPASQQTVAEVIRPESGVRPPILVSFVMSTRENDDNFEPTEHVLAPADEEFRQKATIAVSQLKRHLPEFMIPAIFIPLAFLPLTATGKLNRRLLREEATALSWESLAQYSERSRVKRTPFTAKQRVLQGIVSQVLKLGLKDIGIDDNFFVLGGDSISASRLVAAARNVGYSLTGADLFLRPKLLDLAERLQPMAEKASEDTPAFSLLPDVVNSEQLISSIVTAAAVDPQQIEDVYPCTPMQEGLMALSLKRPGTYVESFNYDLHQEVELERFRSAFDLVVKANPILRTRITYFEAHCFQVVFREEIPWNTHPNYQAYSQGHQVSQMGPNQPLTRLDLISEPPCFILTMHHSIYDGQSLPVIWQQVVSAYKGWTLQPRSFNHFIDYLNRVEEPANFWPAQFQDLNAPIFPALPSPGYTPNPQGALTHTISSLPKTTTAHTLSTYIRLAWALTVSQYTDSSDVVFGALVDGRRVPFIGIDQVSGPTLSSYPLRVKINWDNSVDDMLSTLQSQTTATIPYEHTGLQNIRRRSHEAAIACDFQCQLGIQPELEPEEGSLCTIREDNHLDYRAFANYALVLVCHPRRTIQEQDITVSTAYDPEIIDEYQVQRIVGQFSHFLVQLLHNPQYKVQDVPRLQPSDWQQVAQWNGNLPLSFDQCLHELVFSHRQKNPHASALSAWDGEWDYQELESISTNLAQSLRKAGVYPGSVVPVCMARSKWTIAAMLAVLSAGAAVTAVDPKHPKERIWQILDQVKPNVILVSEETRNIFLDAAAIVFTAPFHRLMSSECSVLDSLATPNSPAFLIFTSGSTGRPKGIILEHRHLCTSIRYHSEPLKASQGVRGLHFASYAFDASVYEIFTVLCNAGCLCIPSEQERLNGIEQFIESHAVNWAVFSPSTFRILRTDCVSTLETVILGGEPMTTDIARFWAPRVNLINGYGPAEATICAASIVNTDWKFGTIGSILGGVGWITLPTDSSQLVPIGAIGELLIEGPVVARGYLSGVNGGFIDPPNWLQRFRKGRPGRVYRTGDLVQYNTDGSIRFVNRRDTQVKLRGQRIELSEVEYFTKLLMGNRNVVAEVVPVPGQRDSRVLVAMVEKTHEPIYDPVAELFCPPSERFRAMSQATAIRLERLVPVYMIPSFFLPLLRIPMTTGGKVDRKRLHQAVSSLTMEQFKTHASGASKQVRPPSTAAERALHQIWADVLDKDADSFGVEESFFSLGGDSICAMQVVSKYSHSGLPITVERIMRLKSISLICNEFEQSTIVTPDVPKQDVKGPFTLRPTQRLFLENAESRYDEFHQSVVLELKRPLPSSKLLDGIQSLVQRHPMLRARFSCDDDRQWFQRISPNVNSSFYYQHHLAIPSIADSQDIFQLSRKRIRIQEGPVFVVDLASLRDGQQFLGLSAHRLVVDHASWDIIVADLEGLIDSRVPQTAPPPPLLSWLQVHPTSNPISQHHVSDLEQLVVPQSHNFSGPTERQNGPDGGNEASFYMSAEETQVLLGSANKAFETKPEELIHAALLYSFAQIFPNRSLPIIYSESYDRASGDFGTDFTRTVGWLSDIWPASIDVENRQNLVDYVRRTKDGRRQAEGLYKGQYLATHTSTQEKHIEVLFSCNRLVLKQTSGDELFSDVSSNVGISTGVGTGANFSLFSIEASVASAQLYIGIASNRLIQIPNVTDQWASIFREALRQIVGCLPSWPPEFTVSDFPLLGLNNTQLANFQRHLRIQMDEWGQRIVDAYPCSPVQEGMLISQAKRAEDYLNQVIWKIQPRNGHSKVEIPRFMRAWQRVVDKHAMLRTVFLNSFRDDGSIDQVVLRGYHGNVKLIPSFTLNPVDVLVRYEPGTMQSSIPPHRMVISYSDSGEAAALLEISHSIIDGLSYQVLLRDLQLAYDEKLESSSDHAYRDHLRYILHKDKNSARSYWQQYLSGFEPTLLQSIQSEEYGATKTSEISSFKCSLPEVASLQAFCQLHEVTMSTVLQVAWAMLLKSYMRSDDVCFGYPTAGRDVAVDNIHDAIGPFVNLMLCRVQFSRHKTLMDLLWQRQEDFANSLQYQYCSLAQITHDHQSTHSGSALFNTALSIQKEVANYCTPKTSITLDEVDAVSPTEV